MRGEMCVLDSTGDTKIMWDPDNSDEVETARDTFKKLRKKGYIAYTVDKKGEQGEVVTEFDPSETKLILTPPVRGG